MAWKKTLNRGGSYFRLLVCSNPSRLDKLLIVLGVVFAIGAGVPFPLIGIVFGQLLDDINSASCSTDADAGASLQSGITTKILYLVYITIFNFIALYIHTACWSLVGERLVRRLREQYFESLLRQEIAFFDGLPSGEISSHLSEDLEIIQTGTSEKVGICITSVSYFVVAYIVAFIKDTKLAGILVSLIPAYLIMGVGGGYFFRRYSARVSGHAAAAMTIVSESLTNLPVVHAFGAGKRLEKMFAERLLKGQSHGMKKSIIAAVQLGLLYFISFSANALAFWQGSREIANSVGSEDSGVTVGAVYTVIFLSIDVSYIISQIAPFLTIFGSAAAANEKFQRTIRRASLIDGTLESDDSHPKPSHGALELCDISFTYPSRPDVSTLDHVSIKIPAMKHTAIVGLSGSGKSTIAALIGRLYDPNSGSITLDGKDIRSYRVSDVRASTAVVQQDAILFNRSILENIAYGLVNSPKREHDWIRPGLLDSSLPDIVNSMRADSTKDFANVPHSAVTREIMRLIRKAVQLADADFVHQLEFGVATSVGPLGSQLSGGQRQRIALARALIREPKILLLDEVTASLDSRSEQKIQHALAKVSKNMTVVSIAHRLSTIQSADNIVVLENGRALEQGSHSELLDLNGQYASMVRLQSLSVLPSGNSSLTTIVGHDKTMAAKEVVPGSSQESSSTGLSASTKVAPSEEALKPSAINPALEAIAPTPKKRSTRSTFKGIGSMLRPQALLIALGLLASAVVGASYSGEAFIFGHTVEALSACNAPSSILSNGAFFALLFFTLALGEFVANVVSGSSFGWVSEKLVFRIRVGAFRSLLHQEIHWHESEGRTPSSLLSHLANDTAALGALAGTTINIVFSILVNMIAGIVLSHIVAWKIAIVLLSVLPVLLGSGFMRLHILAQFQERHRKAFANSVGITIEAVSSIKAIAVFSLERSMLEYYRRSLQGPYKATLKAIAYGNFWLSLAFSASTLVYALAYWWGAKLIVEEGYTQTQFFIVLPALLISAQFSGQLFSLAPDMSKARVAAGNLLDLLEIGPDPKNKRGNAYEDPNPLPFRKTEQDVEAGIDVSEKGRAVPRQGMSVGFREVHFCYPARPQVEVLHGLNLQVEAGQFCALVGPSGSGKSTIISLLERFYLPSSGSILMNGRDITRAVDTSFRDDVALVPQETTLFEGSVAFNISLGSRPGEEATLAEIERACRLANIHDTIAALPQGYSTRCGPQGSNFSGGQKQRLAIARALLRKPRILLLDETTSALDAESEMMLQGALEKTARYITVIAVAHRLHTIQKADVIFMIEDGICVERGTHAELIQSSEAYRSNVMHQALDT